MRLCIQGTVCTHNNHDTTMMYMVAFPPPSLNTPPPPPYSEVYGVQVTDMRTQKELATYRGHNRDVTCAAWHPHHEELFASGGYDGSLIYWLVSNPNPQVGHCSWLYLDVFIKMWCVQQKDT